MDLEGLVITAFLIGALICIVLAFLVGRWFDPIYRCKLMRKLTKKEYVVLNIRRGDGRTIDTRVVKSEGDTVLIGTNLWTIEKGKVYLKFKAQAGLGIADFIKTEREKGKTDKEITNALDKITEENKGFLLSKSQYQFVEEGAPTIYVDFDSIKPLNLEGEKTTVKPAEVGATILSLVLVRTQKALATVTSLSTLQKLIAVGIAINLIITFLAWSAAQEARDTMQAIEARNTGVPAGGTAQGGTVVIKQPSG